LERAAAAREEASRQLHQAQLRAERLRSEHAFALSREQQQHEAALESLALSHSEAVGTLTMRLSLSRSALRGLAGSIKAFKSQVGEIKHKNEG
jgi:hypothetical protein